MLYRIKAALRERKGLIITLCIFALALGLFLRAFGSVKAIKAAEYEQLCAVVPKNAARAVFDHFHPANEEEKT